MTIPEDHRKSAEGHVVAVGRLSALGLDDRHKGNGQLIRLTKRLKAESAFVETISKADRPLVLEKTAMAMINPTPITIFGQALSAH